MQIKKKQLNVITGMNYILKYIKIENCYFKLYQYFTILV